MINDKAMHDDAAPKDRNTTALVNLKVNLKRLTSLFDLLHLGLRVEVTGPLAELGTHVSDRSPFADITGEAATISTGIDKHVKRKGLIYDWYCVMLVAFVEAYLEEGLSLIAGKNPTVLQSGDPVAGQRVFELDSIDDLRTELREQWAKKILRGGPTKWLDRLRSLGGPECAKDCRYRIEHLWATRNLVVHAQGIADVAYVQGLHDQSLQPGERVCVDEKLILWWSEGITEFVSYTDLFFSAYGKRSKKIDAEKTAME